jgi:ParB family chromosome partitioning protein
MANAIKLNLPSADSLFSTQEERDDAQREKVVDISRSEIDSFPDHPFQVKMDDSMMALVESVKAVGIQTPAVVRKKEDGRYEYIAGHRRNMACELAGIDTIPCIIRNMSRDEAIIAMVDSNLQRDIILPSEKAKSYKMKLEALNRQGQRTDLTSSPMATELKGIRTADIVGAPFGDKKDTVHRYIRLTDLIPDLLDMVDNAELREKDKPQIAMRPAVELSYLPKEHQQTVLDAIESEDCTPSHVQAMKMRKFADEGRLSEDVILSIMQEEKPNQAEQFKLPKEKISRFFAPGTPVQKIESDIIRGLELLQRQRERSRDAR